MEKDLKVFELQIQELINRRQMIVGLFALVITGEIGLLFMLDNKLSIFLLFVGLIYVYNFTKSYIVVNNKILEMLYISKEKK